MEIKIKTRKLNEILNIMEMGIPQKTVIEALKSIKISAQENTLKFIVSKQDLAIQYTLDEDFVILEEGSLLIPSQYFIPIIKKSTDEEITIKNEQTKVSIDSINSKLELMTYDLNTFPFIDFETNQGLHANLDYDTINNIYFATKNSIATNTIKPILTGINFDIKNNEIIASSTDARRLSLLKQETNQQQELNFTINKFILQILLKVTNNSNIDIYLDHNQITFKTNNTIIKARVIDGEYPLVTKLIPNQINCSYIVDKNILIPILEKILLLNNTDSSNLKTSINDNNLIINSYFQEFGNIEEKIIIEDLEGKPFTISYAPKFMLDALHSLNGNKIKISLVDEISPFMITNVDNNENIQIISPIRLS